MILSTTNTIEEKTIQSYLGIVSSTAYVSHANHKVSFKDMFKQKKYIEAYEKGIEAAKEEAVQKLKANAEQLHADAIVGIHVDVESVSSGMYNMVSVIGTAVKLL